MATSPESILPPPIRKTFEQFGVIKPAAWPKLDTLTKAITGRKMRYDLQTSSDGTATARVFAQGCTYTGVDGEPERALAHAFHECLKEHGNAQISMFEDEDEADDEEVPVRTITDVQLINVNASYLPPTPPSAPDRFVRTGSRTADGQVIRFDELTGAMIDEDGAVLPIDAVEAMRIQADLTRARG